MSRLRYTLMSRRLRRWNIDSRWILRLIIEFIYVFDTSLFLHRIRAMIYFLGYTFRELWWASFSRCFRDFRFQLMPLIIELPVSAASPILPLRFVSLIIFSADFLPCQLSLRNIFFADGQFYYCYQLSPHTLDYLRRDITSHYFHAACWQLISFEMFIRWIATIAISRRRWCQLPLAGFLSMASFRANRCRQRHFRKVIFRLLMSLSFAITLAMSWPRQLLSWPLFSEPCQSHYWLLPLLATLPHDGCHSFRRHVFGFSQPALALRHCRQMPLIIFAAMISWYDTPLSYEVADEHRYQYAADTLLRHWLPPMKADWESGRAISGQRRQPLLLILQLLPDDNIFIIVLFISFQAFIIERCIADIFILMPMPMILITRHRQPMFSRLRWLRHCRLMLFIEISFRYYAIAAIDAIFFKMPLLILLYYWCRHWWDYYRPFDTPVRHFDDTPIRHATIAADSHCIRRWPAFADFRYYQRHYFCFVLAIAASFFHWHFHWLILIRGCYDISSLIIDTISYAFMDWLMLPADISHASWSYHCWGRWLSRHCRASLATPLILMPLPLPEDAACWCRRRWWLRRRWIRHSALLILAAYFRWYWCRWY